MLHLEMAEVQGLQVDTKLRAPVLSAGGKACQHLGRRILEIVICVHAPLTLSNS